MPALRQLWLSGNRITRVGDSAFSNSTQLHELDLSDNQMEQMDGRCFAGQFRLRLRLAGNRLNQLPVDLFHPKRVAALEWLDLSRNLLAVLPVAALKKQHSSLQRLSVAGNQIGTIPQNSDLLVNVKECV